MLENIDLDCGAGVAAIAIETIAALANAPTLGAFPRVTPLAVAAHLTSPRPVRDSLVAQMCALRRGYRAARPQSR